MATNNAVNISGSGIVSYDGAGTFSALANPLTVPNGGTAASSFTAYAVLCGGTTSTGTVQNVSGVGTAGQVLTSNGAGSLPTWQNLSAGSGHTKLFFNTTIAVGTLSDSTSYYIGSGNATTVFTATGQAPPRQYILTSGTITKAYGSLRVKGTLASTENVTIKLVINNTTTLNISTTLQLNAVNVDFSNTGFSQSVSAGDYVELVLATPAWATNPSDVDLSCTVYI